MEIIVALSLIFLAWHAWRFFVLPTRSSVVLGKHRWTVEDGNLKIARLENRGRPPFTIPVAHVFYRTDVGHDMVERHRGASSHSTTVGTLGPGGLVTGSTHTVHREALSWKEKGRKYCTAWFYNLNQDHTNERLLLTGPEHFGYADGKIRCQNIVSYLADKSVEVSPSEKRVLVRWLRHHGMNGTPDESKQEQHFHKRSAELLASFRQRFGYQEGDLDHLRLSKSLEPLSYTKLNPNGEIVAHEVEHNATHNERVELTTFTGRRYESWRKVGGVHIRTTPNAGVWAPVSSAMLEKIETLIKPRGQTIFYTSFDS